MEILNDYVHERFVHLSENLELYKADAALDRLHQIRVEIKKIMAMMKLINYSHVQFKYRTTYAPLKKIFQKAGVIREPDVFFGLLIQYEIAGVEDALIPHANEAVGQTNDFLLHIVGYLNDVKMVQQEINKGLSRVVKKDVRLYLKYQQRRLRKQAAHKPNEKNLHKIRKTLKAVCYVLSAMGRSGQKRTVAFDKLQERIGTWHDQKMLISLMKWKGLPVDAELLTQDCQKLKEKIKRMITRIVHP